MTVLPRQRDGVMLEDKTHAGKRDDVAEREEVKREADDHCSTGTYVLSASLSAKDVCLGKSAAHTLASAAECSIY